MIAERSQQVRVKAVPGLGLMFLATSTHFVFDLLPDLRWSEASRCIGWSVPCEVWINPGWLILGRDRSGR